MTSPQLLLLLFFWFSKTVPCVALAFLALALYSRLLLCGIKGTCPHVQLLLNLSSLECRYMPIVQDQIVNSYNWENFIEFELINT